ncbi:MAG: hypothetical protein WD403_07860, partial [Pirellulales bacterium]
RAPPTLPGAKPRRQRRAEIAALPEGHQIVHTEQETRNPNDTASATHTINGTALPMGLGSKNMSALIPRNTGTADTDTVNAMNEVIKPASHAFPNRLTQEVRC